VLAYQTQLENLCDQVIRERDQEKMKKLMDQIFHLLVRNQQSAGEAYSPHFCCTGLEPSLNARFLPDDGQLCVIRRSIESYEVEGESSDSPAQSTVAPG